MHEPESLKELDDLILSAIGRKIFFTDAIADEIGENRDVVYSRLVTLQTARSVKSQKTSMGSKMWFLPEQESEVEGKRTGGDEESGADDPLLELPKRASEIDWYGFGVEPESDENEPELEVPHNAASPEPATDGDAAPPTEQRSYKSRNVPTEQEIEDVIAEVGSKSRAATKLGYTNASGFRTLLGRKLELQAAYDRGLERFVGDHEPGTEEGEKGSEEAFCCENCGDPMDLNAEESVSFQLVPGLNGPWHMACSQYCKNQWMVKHPQLKDDPAYGEEREKGRRGAGRGDFRFGI